MRAMFGSPSSISIAKSSLGAKATLGPQVSGFSMRSASSLLTSISMPKDSTKPASTLGGSATSPSALTQERELSTSSTEPATGAVAGSREIIAGSVLEASDDLDAILRDCRVPVIVDFYADWCGPCRVLAPILKKAVEENGKVVLVKVNVDKAEEITHRYEIASLPTVTAFRAGVMVDSFIGSRDPAFVKNFIASLTKDH
eukprot:jgi/Hompol1/6252/HPOL_004908-RA